MATNPQLTPAEFAHKWRGIQTGERASAQAQFMDLCRMLGEPTIHEADPIGELHQARRGAPILQWVLGASEAVGDPATVEEVCREPGDDYLVAVAKVQGAAIVTGDGDLLALREWTNVRILTAREYLDLV